MKRARADSGPEALGAVIGEYLARTGLDRAMEAGKLGRMWAEVAGPALAKRTRLVGGIRSGVLRIEVDSSALLSELSGFERERLTNAMRERFKRQYIQKLSFQLGSWEKEAATPQRKDAKNAKDS